jgi:hypothetical protein
MAQWRRLARHIKNLVTSLFQNRAPGYAGQVRAQPISFGTASTIHLPSGLLYRWIFASSATQKIRLTGVLRTFGLMEFFGDFKREAHQAARDRY